MECCRLTFCLCVLQLVGAHVREAYRPEIGPGDMRPVDFRYKLQPARWKSRAVQCTNIPMHVCRCMVAAFLLLAGAAYRSEVSIVAICFACDEVACRNDYRAGCGVLRSGVEEDHLARR